MSDDVDALSITGGSHAHRASPLLMSAHATPALQSDAVPGVLRHLRYLTHSFAHRGRRISYINIYARPRESAHDADLESITARESGFEGIACVDDAARAAILALRAYEQIGAVEALELAQAWLGFVQYMQEADGRFTNFIIDGSGEKNRSGRTSRTGGQWWTARAMWALATAWRVTGEQPYRRSLLRGRLAPTRDMKKKAVQALALMELYQRQPATALLLRICALCDAIVASGPRYFGDTAGQADVCLWGYHQLQAVARAGRLFSRRDYVAACERTVQNLIQPVIVQGFYHEYPRQQDHQCAYDIAPMALGLAELSATTGQSHYRDLALDCAAWLDGNNLAGAALYDAHRGRCSDGITAGAVSLNCGAESAIEAGFIELMRRDLCPAVDAP